MEDTFLSTKVVDNIVKISPKSQRPKNTKKKSVQQLVQREETGNPFSV